ncbi:MAG: hypothetical protein ACLU84_00625 [Clostridia bacterium]
MDIFNRIKTIFTTTGKERKINYKDLEKRFWKILFSIIHLIAKVLSGAIILVVLAHIAPELRQQVPSLYRFVDLIMSCTEYLYSYIWQILF